MTFAWLSILVLKSSLDFSPAMLQYATDYCKLLSETVIAIQLDSSFRVTCGGLRLQGTLQFAPKSSLPALIYCQGAM